MGLSALFSWFALVQLNLTLALLSLLESQVPLLAKFDCFLGFLLQLLYPIHYRDGSTKSLQQLTSLEFVWTLDSKCNSPEAACSLSQCNLDLAALGTAERSP